MDEAEIRKIQQEEAHRQSALRKQLCSVLADYPIGDQSQVLLDLLAGLARSGHGYDLGSIIDILQQAKDEDDAERAEQDDAAKREREAELAKPPTRYRRTL